MARILVFGTGGVGCIYAYICGKAGADVTAVCRSNYDAVKEHGITIKSQLWGTVTCQPRVVRDVSEAASYGPYDFVLVCTKSFPGKAHMIRDVVSPDTAIVLAQNGIAIEDEYVDLYPNNAIISGVVYLPTTQTKPGYCVHGSMELLEIGTFPADATAHAKARAQQLSDLFKAAGARAPVYDDVQPRRWIKLGVNVAWNPTSALSMCDDANFLCSSPDADAMIVNMYKEVALIASAAGYPGLLTDEEIEIQMQRARLRKQHGGIQPSMLVDVMNGRPIEVDAILGNPVKIARKLGVEATRMELLYVLAKARNFELSKDDRWLPLPA